MSNKRVDIKYDDLKAAIEQTISMAEASKVLGVKFATFKRRAVELGLYVPNQGKRGALKPKMIGKEKIALDDILSGNHPMYQSSKLRHRLINEGIKENCCSECGIAEWNGKPLVLNLDHIDGNSFNHQLINLRILCPNCHSQTPTFCRGQGKYLPK